MEYINRELALKLLERNSITKNITFSDGVSIYDTIANIPTEDVVPKSELSIIGVQNMALENTNVDLKRRLVIEEAVASVAIGKASDMVSESKREVARGIFEEIDGFMEKNIEEITKAYKGGIDNGQTVLCAKFSAFIDAKKYLAKLKKKYTEGE